MLVQLVNLLHHSIEVVVNPFMVRTRLGKAGGEMLEPEHDEAQRIDEGGSGQGRVAVEGHTAVSKLTVVCVAGEWWSRQAADSI